MATQGLYRFSLVCAIISFLFMFVAFASPFWYQSWRRVHSSFGNIGLWHICLNGYIMPNDPIMKSYVGCWWIHSTEFDIVKDHIQPVWFRFVQTFSVICLILDLVALVILIFYFPRWVRPKYLKYRIRCYFIGSGLSLVSAFLVFIVSLVFAEKSNDSEWMPRPWMNYLSWSYGLCVVSGFFCAFGGMSLFVLSLIHKEKELHGDPELVAAAEAAAKQRQLEKQDERVRQQGGMMMDSVGPRTPHGSGQVYRTGPYQQQPYPSQYQHQPYPGQYQQQAAYPDKPDHSKHGYTDQPPQYGSHGDPPPHYRSKPRMSSAAHSTAGSQVSQGGSQGTRAAESFV